MSNENKILSMIPEQAILIDGIRIMNGTHALSLNNNFTLKKMLYKLSGQLSSRWTHYIVLNNYTTFCQLISFLTRYYIVKVDGYSQDGFTMLITIEDSK